MVSIDSPSGSQSFTSGQLTAFTDTAEPHKSADRLAWADVGKGMSILLVVFFHAHLYLAAFGLSNDLFRLLNWAFNPVRMPLFFALSGALAAGLLQRSWATLAWQKLWYLSALFALWSTVHLVLFKYLLWHPGVDFADPLPLVLLEGWVRPQTGIWFIWALIVFLTVAKCLRPVPRLAILLSLTAGIFGKSDLMIDWGFNYKQQNLLMYMPFLLFLRFTGRGSCTGSRRARANSSSPGPRWRQDQRWFHICWAGPMRGPYLILCVRQAGCSSGLGSPSCCRK